MFHSINQGVSFDKPGFKNWTKYAPGYHRIKCHSHDSTTFQRISILSHYTEDVPTTSFVLSTDYDKYLQIYSCNQFPRDNPLMYEQHNYLFSRQAVWKGGLKEFQKGLDRLQGFGIDTGPLMLHDQEECDVLAPGNP